MASVDRKRGEAFSEWWAQRPSSADTQHGEALARSAWDAAICQAWVLLDKEKDRYVNSHMYETAAAILDLRELSERLFTSPGQSGREHRQMEKLLEFFRRFSDEQLAKLRQIHHSAPYELALEIVLRERCARTTSE